MKVCSINNCFALLFFTLLCVSCKRKKEFKVDGNKLIKTEYYSSGKIRSVTTYNSDTILNGLQTFYYPDGKIQSTVNWLNNKMIGQNSQYYENGKMKSYKFFNHQEELIYVSDYDSLGKILNEKGEITPPLIYLNTDKLQQHVLSADIFLIEPPNVQVSAEIFTISNHDTVPTPFSNADNHLEVRYKFTGASPDEMAVKTFVKNFNKLKKWDETEFLSLHSK